MRPRILQYLHVLVSLDLFRVLVLADTREELLPRLFGPSPELCIIKASLAKSCMNVFLQASLDRMEFVISEYFMAVVDVLHIVVTKVSHEDGRLVISNRAFSSCSSLIVIP